jgi:xylulokinase
LGCGVIEPGRAFFGLGTFLCITPAFERPPDPETMIALGLSTEHHAVPGLFVSFIYNQGGSLLKWYRDTFAAEEHRQAQAAGEDIYARLIAEIPPEPGQVLVLPHFSVTGPPHYIAGSSGVILGLKLDTTRGAILRGILESPLYALREVFERLPETSAGVSELRAAGGGSRSDAWLEIAAAILNCPVIRMETAEAGALGGAILAGAAAGEFASLAEGVQAMVRSGPRFDPQPALKNRYDELYARYLGLWPALGDLTKPV